MALSRSESVRSSVSYDARSDLTELTENDFAFLKQSGELNSGQDILHQSPPLPSSSTFCPPDFMPSQSFFTLGSRNRGDSGKPTSTSSSQQYESGGSTVTGSASKIAKMASKHEQVVADIKEYYISEIEDLGQIIAQQKNTILGLQERTGGLEAQGGFSARDEKQIQDLLAANQKLRRELEAHDRSEASFDRHRSSEQRVQQLEAQLQEMRKSSPADREDSGAASGANSPILMEISDLRDKNRSMSAQIQTLDYRLRISSQERKALVAENKALLETQSRLTLDQSVLNSQLRKAEKERDNARMRVDTLQTEVNRTRDKLAEFQRNEKSLRSGLEKERRKNQLEEPRHTLGDVWGKRKKGVSARDLIYQVSSPKGSLNQITRGAELVHSEQDSEGALHARPQQRDATSSVSSSARQGVSVSYQPASGSPVAAKFQPPSPSMFSPSPATSSAFHTSSHRSPPDFSSANDAGAAGTARRIQVWKDESTQSSPLEQNPLNSASSAHAMRTQAWRDEGTQSSPQEHPPSLKSSYSGFAAANSGGVRSARQSLPYATQPLVASSNVGEKERAQNLELLDKSLMSMQIERKTLDSRLLRLDSNSTKTIAGRRNKELVESRLQQLDTGITEHRIAIKHLQSGLRLV